MSWRRRVPFGGGEKFWNSAVVAPVDGWADEIFSGSMNGMRDGNWLVDKILS